MNAISPKPEIGMMLVALCLVIGALWLLRRLLVSESWFVRASGVLVILGGLLLGLAFSWKSFDFVSNSVDASSSDMDLVGRNRIRDILFQEIRSQSVLPENRDLGRVLRHVREPEQRDGSVFPDVAMPPVALAPGKNLAETEDFGFDETGLHVDLEESDHSVAVELHTRTVSVAAPAMVAAVFTAMFLALTGVSNFYDRPKTARR